MWFNSRDPRHIGILMKQDTRTILEKWIECVRDDNPQHHANLLESVPTPVEKFEVTFYYDEWMKDGSTNNPTDMDAHDC